MAASWTAGSPSPGQRRIESSPSSPKSPYSEGVLVPDIWDFITLEDDDADRTFADLALSEGSFVEIHAAQFEEPCPPVGASAVFYRVRYRSGREPEGVHNEHFIGKDLAYSKAEVEFYHKLRLESEQEAQWAALSRLTMECPGIAMLQCSSAKSSRGEAPKARPLLLLENLYSSFCSMRLLDLKLGAETCVEGRLSKDKLHAWKSSCIDQRTNSAVEGFRVEGIEQPPRALEELMSEAVARLNQRSFDKKLVNEAALRRFFLQRLRAQEFLAAFLDLSALGAGSESQSHSVVWSALEQVGTLVQTIMELPAPQQWVGSSLALALEVGHSVLSKPPHVIVKIFDWGHAELCTREDYTRLTSDERARRIQYWRKYGRAVGRFHWELCRLAAHRCCCAAWHAFVFEVRYGTPSDYRAPELRSGSQDKPTVYGMGIYELKGGYDATGGGENLVVPLVGGGCQGSPGSPQIKAVNGMLHFQLSTPVRDNQALGRGAPPQHLRGEGSILLNLRGATQFDGMDASIGLVVVRVIGFESGSDARAHMEAWKQGQPEPVPLRHTYARSTAPGKALKSSILWEDSLEFVGLGEAEAARAAARLREIANGGALKLSSKEQKSWPQAFPPTIGEPMAAEAFERTAKKFVECRIPWLSTDAAIPEHWL